MKLTISKKALLFQFLMLVFLSIVFASTMYAQGLPVDLTPPTPNPVRFFYQNDGQIIDFNDDAVPSIKYYTDGGIRRVYFADHKIHHVLHRHDEANNADSFGRIDMTFMCPDWETGCGTLSAHDQTDDFLNFFLPHCSSGITNVAGYKRVVYEEAYPNVNVHVTSDENGLVMYLEIKPGAAPDGVVFKFEGQDSLSVFQGDLNVYIGGEALYIPDGNAYQVDGGGNVTFLNWTPSWQVLSSNTAGIVLDGAYDPLQTTVIKIQEPPMGIPTASGVAWGAYHDVNTTGGGKVIKADMSGDPVTTKVYSAQAQSTFSAAAFPATAGIQVNIGAGLDLFIAHFNEISERKWGTYYGGSGSEHPLAMALDNNDGIYITGVAGSGTLSMPVPSGNTGHVQSQGQGYILKFSKSAGTPQWLTRIDGSCPSCGPNGEQKWPVLPQAIDVDDGDGKLYVAGTIHDVNVQMSTTVQNGYFPLKAGPTGSNRYYQSSYTGQVGFIMEFNLILNTLNWSTLFNNKGTIQTVKKRNNGVVRTLYVGGSTVATANSGTYTSPTITPPGNHAHSHLVNPGSSAYFQTANQSSTPFYEGLVAAFDDNFQLKWSTLFGGSGTETVASLDITNDGDLWIAGSTTTTAVPSTPSTSANNNGQFPIYDPGGNAFFQGTKAGGLTDDFIARFDAGFNLEWCSYFGGQDSDEGLATGGDSRDEHPILCTDRYSNVIMAGTTQKNTTANPNFNGVTNVDVPGMYYQPDNASSTETLKGKDAYYAIFNNQNELKYSQHYGGNGVNTVESGIARADEMIHDISVVNGRRIYGILTSRSMLTPPGCPVPGVSWCDDDYDGGGDVFLNWLPYDLISGASGVNGTKTGSGFSVSAYPNPVKDELTLSFISQKKQAITIQIFDNIGRLLMDQQLAAIAGNNNFVLNTQTLPAGIYFLKINDRYSYEAIKVCKN